MAVELIQPVAIQPTLWGKLATLWDFAVVKLWAVTGVLATIGLGIPAIQETFPSWHFLEWMPVWFIHLCQFCALLSFLGIAPTRVVAQPNLPAKAAVRAAASTGEPKQP